MVNYEKLEKVVERLANTELKEYDLPENFYGCKSIVYPTKYGLQLSIIMLTKEPFNQKESDIFHDINKDIKSLIRSTMSDFVENISSSVSTIDSYEKTKWWFDEQKKLNESKKHLTELDRTWRDTEFESQYNRIKDKISGPIEKMVESYYEDDDKISVYDKDEKRLMTFYKKNDELFFNLDISNYMSEILPPYIWARHGQHLISDLFEEYFPQYKVKTVTPAYMF